MDQNPKGRNLNNQPRHPDAQCSTDPHPGPPQQSGFTPRQAVSHNPKAPGPSLSQNSLARVEQVSRAMSTLSTADRPIPVGRGTVRGNRVLKSTEYRGLPKPMSVESEKQGTVGQVLELTTNYFALESVQTDFNPEEYRIGVQRCLLGKHRKALGGYFFNGFLLYSSIKFATVEMRNHGLQLWPGYETNFKMCDTGLLLQSKICTKVMRDETVLDFFRECMKNHNGNVSQHTRFGTVTPTYYNVIGDTLKENWNPDKMQLLTYKLTHMYYNCSSTIRVPGPCQLAYKLAFLTAQSLGRTPNIALNKLLYFL